jgi:hypothetical protein
MLQRKAQDQRVTGDEHDGQRQQEPPASKHSVVPYHSFHPAVELAEITRSKGPPQGQTAGR